LATLEGSQVDAGAGGFYPCQRHYGPAFLTGWQLAGIGQRTFEICVKHFGLPQAGARKRLSVAVA